MSDSAASDAATEHRPGRSFWIGLALGGAVMAFGIRGALMDLGTESSGSVAPWVLGANLLHDLVIAPIAIGIGWGVGRIVPDRSRAPIQAGLTATGITLAVGRPSLRGYGREIVPDNRSVQPLDYATAVLTVLAIVWFTVAIWLLIRFVRTPETPAHPD